MPRPGELSLAHGGVLFLDELPEFSRRVLESLRQPLEQGVVHIARASRSAMFPARVHARRRDESLPVRLPRRSRSATCRCPPPVVERYQQRLSGPLRDRFDLSVAVQAVPWQDLRDDAGGESSRRVRSRVRRGARPATRPSGRPQRPPGRPAPAARTADPADEAADACSAAGAVRLGLSVRALTACPAGRPDDRGPRGRDPRSRRGTWQRPCTFRSRTDR